VIIEVGRHRLANLTARHLQINLIAF